MIFSMTAAMSKNFKCILKAFKSFCKCNDIQILIYKSGFIVGDACKLKFDSNILRSSKRLSTLIFYLRKNKIFLSGTKSTKLELNYTTILAKNKHYVIKNKTCTSPVEVVILIFKFAKLYLKYKIFMNYNKNCGGILLL